MNFKKHLMTGALSSVLFLGACGGDNRDAPSTDDVDAEGIAQNSCATCHGEDFSGAVGPALQDTSLSEEAFGDIVRNGQGLSMPSFSETQISDEEISALYTFFTE